MVCGRDTLGLVIWSIRSVRCDCSAVANINLMVLHATFGVGVYMILRLGATNVRPPMAKSDVSEGKTFIVQ